MALENSELSLVVVFTKTGPILEYLKHGQESKCQANY